MQETAPAVEPSPLQTLIGKALKDAEQSRYTLARACGWRPDSIYRKLIRPTMHTGIEKMLAALGAEVTINGRTVRLRMKDDGTIVAWHRKVSAESAAE